MKSKRISIKIETLNCATLFLIVSAVFFLLNTAGISDHIEESISAIFIGIATFALIYYFSNICRTKDELWIVLIGYLVRILFLLIDRYGSGSLSRIISITGGDAEGFWEAAVNYYLGHPLEEYTKYPYIIVAILNIFGLNRLIAQYFNILLWTASVVIVYKLFQLLNIRGKIQKLGIILMVFWPWYLMLTYVLMRESLIIFLNLLSFYFFVKWFKKDKIVHLLLAFCFILFSAVLHSASIVIGLSYGVFYAIWDKRKQHIRIRKKTIIIGMLIMAVLIMAYMNDTLRTMLFSKFLIRENIYESVNRHVMYLSDGNSDYLRSMRANNFLQLCIYTVIRMIYFCFSPVPWEWSGLFDIAIFLIDAFLYLCIYAFIIRKFLKQKQKDPLIMLCLLCAFFSAGIFAWGVSNVGTAMRHRTKLIGITIVMLCYVLNDKKEVNKSIS